MKFHVTRSSEKINSVGGSVLSGSLLNKSGLKINSTKIQDVKSPKAVPTADILASYTGLLLAGHTAYDDIKLFAENSMFKSVYGLKATPSAETLRQRLDNLGENHLNTTHLVIKSAATKLINLKKCTKIKTEMAQYTPVDLDVSPFDNSKTQKEGCGRTYKNHDGFSPMFGYIGREGFMLNAELRPGTQHCQKGTPEFITECLNFIYKLKPKKTQRFLFRLDSGNDASDNIKILMEEKRFVTDFIIKRNLRFEDPVKWLSVAKADGEGEKMREGKTRYVGTVGHMIPGGSAVDYPINIVYEVIERTIDKKGQPLLISDIEVNTFWTTLGEEPETVIGLYHDHGTSEQFHSEVKTDMGVERLPSQHFDTNSLVLSLTMLAYNILRTIGVDLVEFADLAPVRMEVSRRRIRCVLRDIIRAGCKYVERSNSRFIRFGCECPWFEVISALHLKYSC